jgi:hypothetical protein
VLRGLPAARRWICVSGADHANQMSARRRSQELIVEPRLGIPPEIVQAAPGAAGSAISETLDPLPEVGMVAVPWHRFERAA